MAEWICRSLRDGCVEGEHATALSISDSIQSPFGSHAFNYFLSTLVSNISSLKSQSRGLVIVALERSPTFYFNFLKSRGFDPSALDKWIRILDCYSDPLGWKNRLLGLTTKVDLSSKTGVTFFREVEDMEKLFTSIVDLGKGVAGQSKVRFSLVIDSVSAMLRHASLPSVSGLINNLRSHAQVSSMFWLIHSDLHEARATAALEYMSSIVSNLEPVSHTPDGQRVVPESLLWLEHNSRGGKFNVHMKRRNGKVKLMSEDFHMETSGIKFVPVSSGNVMVNQNLIPKVQFNLQLSEKERVDKANVVLPFEHQGNGKTVEIYDGRRSLSEGQNDPYSTRPVSSNKLITETDSGKGEIHYLRDSDDEPLDSDEDPDDDLDI